MGTTTKKRFTVDELHRMDRAGIFTNERVELINGEVFLMTIGPRHAARVERARDIFNDPQGDRYTTCLTLRRGDVVTLTALPDIKINIEDFLG